MNDYCGNPEHSHFVSDVTILVEIDYLNVDRGIACLVEDLRQVR